MTVLLVLGTFLVFIVLDYAMNRRKVIATVPSVSQTAALAGAPEGPGSEYVNGFHVPDNLSYHAGHSWLVRERKNVVRVGADEFAVALAGKVEKVELPKPGQWIRQGQKILSFYRHGVKTEMVSPTEGEVLEVNVEVLANPARLREEPYGKGWLVAMHVPDEEATSRNLVPKIMVRDWMRASVERLYAMQPSLAGAVAADGGRPAEDLLAAFPEADWKAVTGEFFLTT
ncbi:MAG: glycine cleavage system protein H [Candidatus Sulfopaludibacter sp.]|nr:glycine cleavage system protein H [Candidatus Sulfopaludibacter sp.]